MTPGVGGKLLLATLIGAVIAAIIGALLILDSPAEQRALKADAKRVSELRQISRAIDLYWSRYDALPPDLEALERESGAFVATVDPISGMPYTYRVTGGASYELCAVFERASTGDVSWWAHGVGEACFTLKAERINR